MALFLSPEELAVLTGKKYKRAQINALVVMAIPFRVNAAGRAVVTTAAVETGVLPAAREKTTGWKSNKVKD